MYDNNGESNDKKNIQHDVEKGTLQWLIAFAWELSWLMST